MIPHLLFTGAKASGLTLKFASGAIVASDEMNANEFLVSLLFLFPFLPFA